MFEQGENMAIYPTQFARSLEGAVTVTTPRITDKQHISIAREWVQRQGKYWPEELTAELVAANLELVYAPYWIASASGSAQWSASIGHRRSVIKVCPTCRGRGRHYDDSECYNCNGSGRVQDTEIFWTSQSGVVEAAINGKIVENLDAAIRLKCGKPDTSAPEIRLNTASQDDYQILRPQSTSISAGRSLAEKLLKDELQSKAHRSARSMGDETRNINVGYVQTANVAVRTWLYPVYIGYYDYQAERLPVQIDGVTGKIWGDVPRDVKAKRFRDQMIIAAIVAVALLIGFLIYSSSTDDSANYTSAGQNSSGAIFNQRMTQTRAASGAQRTSNFKSMTPIPSATQVTPFKPTKTPIVPSRTPTKPQQSSLRPTPSLTRIPNLAETYAANMRRGTARAINVTLTTEAKDSRTATAVARLAYATPRPTISPARLHVGGTAIVEVTDARLNVRSGPGTEYRVLTTVTSRTTVLLIDGPQRNSNSDYIWWKVRTPDGIEGWLVEAIGAQKMLLPFRN